MYEGKKILGLIGARGGSKGLPGKNIRPLSGKPLIAWSIDAALASRYIDRVVVSTDDEEIASVSRACGGDVPFLRPADLATDAAKSIDFVLHALGDLEKEGAVYDFLMLLQPTSPLRTVQDIDLSVELLFSKKAEAVVSVCEAEHHPFLSNVLPPDGSMKDFLRPETANMNRQQLPPYYRLNGAIYLVSVPYLIANRDFIGSGAYAYVMPVERSIDIDTAFDFSLAECLVGRKQ